MPTARSNVGYQGVKPADICSRFLDPTETLPAPCRMKRRWRVVLLRAKGEILGTVEAPDVALAKAAAAVQFGLDEVQRTRIIVQE